MTKLSREHREIIDLVYYHEKSVDDAAQILGIPPATVKTRMFYARKKLAELVQRGISRAALLFRGGGEEALATSQGLPAILETALWRRGHAQENFLERNNRLPLYKADLARARPPA